MSRVRAKSEQALAHRYQLDLNDAKFTTKEYKEFIQDSFELLQGNASKADHYNMAQMLLLYFSWRNYYGAATLSSTAGATFHIAADPWYTISRFPYNSLLVWNTTSSVGPFNEWTEFIDGYMQFKTYDKVAVQMISKTMEAKPVLPYLFTELGFNLQSFFTAAAINRGLLDFGVLQATAPGGTVAYAAMPSDFLPYKDPLYPTMDPIYCNSTHGKCVLYMYPWGLYTAVEGAYYPLFESIGNNSGGACKCPISSDEIGCYYANFFIGLGFLGGGEYSNAYPFNYGFFTKYPNSDTLENLNECTI
jgi:hypothetical protein